MQSCECKLWDKNIDQYNDMFNFVEKYHGPSYEGDEYSFCPWCGTDLRVEEEDEFEDYDEDEGDEDDEDEEIDTTPMHGEDDEDDEDEEEEYEELDVEFEPEEISYPVMEDGWVNQN